MPGALDFYKSQYKVGSLDINGMKIAFVLSDMIQSEKETESSKRLSTMSFLVFDVETEPF